MSDASVASPATPRINSTLMSKYLGEQVRFIGRVKESSRKHAVLEASDKGQVTIVYSQDNILEDNKIVEVIGRVKDNSTIQEILITEISDGFIDLDLYEDVIQLTQKYPEIFF
ncbi:17699_t:CDS:2 [Acaulospora morrowiae]|uniref:17699_t:CDS:1 n=1 Tax=Acaulospora morrowiae TaxID=94023 RepID=A0A9N9DVE4_9GLOM|nr:17699_t:CDS:2 [Acaulospora morrowiae]